MVDFKLSEEQLALQRMARDFVEREAKPLIAELDKKTDPADCFSMDLLKRTSELGFRTLAIPEKYGGMGVEDTVTCLIVSEELSVGDPSLASGLMNGRKLYHMLSDPKVAREAQRDKWLRAFCENPTFLYAVVLTEPDAGCDNMLPYTEPDGGVRTAAVRDGDYYVINGMKHFIAHAGIAKLYCVFTRTDRTKGILEGCTCFLVPEGHPGMKLGRVHDKMGYRLLRNQEVIFEDCRVPAEWRLGPEGNGIPVIRASIRSDGILNAARSLGVARAAYEAIVDYCKERVQGGVPIIRHGVIGSELARMYTDLLAMRSMVWNVAWSMDHLPPDPRLVPAAMSYCTEKAFEIAHKAAEIAAGIGIMKEAPFEKLLRDSFCLKHLDGGNYIKRLKVAAAL